MTKRIDYKLVKLDFFTDFNKILDKNLYKLLKSYFYSRIIVYNKINYEDLNILNECNFLFNVKLQNVLMNHITVYFLIKKYYNLIFTSILDNSHKIHVSKESNLSNILEMLNSNSTVHTQKGGGMKQEFIKFVFLIGLFLSFFIPASATASLPAIQGDLIKEQLPETFTRPRRQQTINREKKKEELNKQYESASKLLGAGVVALVTSLLVPAITALSEDEIKELLENVVAELNTETNDIYDLVAGHCDSFVTTLHKNGLFDSSSIKEIVPEEFEQEIQTQIQENGEVIEEKVDETITNTILDYFAWTTKPIVAKSSAVANELVIKEKEPQNYDDLVDDVVVGEEENEEIKEVHGTEIVDLNSAGTSLFLKDPETSKEAKKLERYIQQSRENFKYKDDLTSRYKYLCNTAFKSNIIISQSNGMFLIKQLNGHVSLVSENFSMMDQLKSFFIVMKENADKKIKASVWESPNPIFKQIIQKIEIFDLIMSNSIKEYFSFSDMQTFNQTVNRVRQSNEKVRAEVQWLNFSSPLDKRTQQMNFLAEQEEKKYEAHIHIQHSELQREIDAVIANETIISNLEKAKIIEDTTNSTRQINEAKQKAWGEFFDSNFGKDNPLSQFISTTLNGGLIEGIFSPLFNNIKKYGYDILIFIFVAGAVLVFTYNLKTICFSIGGLLLKSKKDKPESVSTNQLARTNQSENLNTVVLAKLPDDNQILQIKYDENGRAIEFDLIVIRSHMKGNIKDKLVNLFSYYKQHNDKLILFYYNDEILCGSFITIQENKILIETIDGRPIQISYEDIIDPITTPYLTTSYIRNKYIECKTIFENKTKSNPLSSEKLFAKQLQLLKQLRSEQKHSKQKPSKQKRKTIRRSSSGSSSSSSGSSSSSDSSRSSSRRSRRTSGSSSSSEYLPPSVLGPFPKYDEHDEPTSVSV
jgi:hypothetical protein